MTAVSTLSGPTTEKAETSPGRTSGSCSARYSRSCGQMFRPLMMMTSFFRPMSTTLPLARYPMSPVSSQPSDDRTCWVAFWSEK